MVTAGLKKPDLLTGVSNQKTEENRHFSPSGGIIYVPIPIKV